MINNIHDKSSFVLASSSPRRISLLSQTKIEFKVVPPDSSVEERFCKTGNSNELAMQIAKAKASSILEKFPESIVLAADTIVVKDEEILGKPKDLEDAFNMIKSLSGERHHVITGFAVMTSKYQKIENVVTEVEFRKLNSVEINEYILENESLDKAGGYAIQGKGYFLVDKINGSYTNVIGFPIKEILKVLKEFGISQNVDNMEFPNASSR